jgi:hypothetical protein
MALNAGDAACSSGLAQRIYNAIIGGTNTGFSGSMTTAQTDSIKALCYGIAVGVVAEIQSNASVSVTAPIDAFGTGIPAAPVALSGGVT